MASDRRLGWHAFAALCWHHDYREVSEGPRKHGTPSTFPLEGIYLSFLLANVAQPLFDPGGINFGGMAGPSGLPGSFAVGPRQTRRVDVKLHFLRQRLRAAAIQQPRAADEQQAGVPIAPGDLREGPDRDVLAFAFAKPAHERERERLRPAARRLRGAAAFIRDRLGGHAVVNDMSGWRIASAQQRL